MSNHFPPLGAYFQHEEDARRAADALETLFQTYVAGSAELDGRCWLLSVVLPETPALATFHMDTALMSKVEELVEGYGGEVWDPEVLAEINRRLADPLDTWGPPTTHMEMMAAVERERLAQRGGTDNAAVDGHDTEPLDGDEQ